jgi:hypothetical protein
VLVNICWLVVGWLLVGCWLVVGWFQILFEINSICFGNTAFCDILVFLGGCRSGIGGVVSEQNLIGCLIK